MRADSCLSLIVSLLYWGISMALPALAGLPISGIPLPTLLYSGASLVLYALVGVASGFMISMLSANSVAVNAIANGRHLEGVPRDDVTPCTT